MPAGPGVHPGVTTYLLIPGAGGSAWVFHRVVPLLEAAGHQGVAVELPTGDDSAGWREYRDAALAALGSPAGPVVVVGQSMGGFTAPLVALAHPVAELVLLNAMLPLPGETGGAWWGAVGQPAAAAASARADGRPEAFDPVTDFLHDVPPAVLAAALEAGEPAQSGTPFAQPWPATAWPDVPTRVLAGRDDRLFPLTLQRQVARERLGLDVTELPGGHLAALSQPRAVATALLGG